jgi:hypothetical protein
MPRHRGAGVSRHLLELSARPDHDDLTAGTGAGAAGCRTKSAGYPTNEYPMEDAMLARAAVPRAKRRCVEFRRTRSPRDVLISLPFRQPTDCARAPMGRTEAPRATAMQQGR